MLHEFENLILSNDRTESEVMAAAIVEQVSLVATSCAMDKRSWDVLVTGPLSSHQICITDPFSADQEDDLKWYLEDRATSDPFAESRAATVENNLELYAQNLYGQLAPAFIELKLDFAAKQFYLAISDRTSDQSIHRLHWEALEHPILRHNMCVYRTQDNANLGVSTIQHHQKTSMNLLFMTARVIDRSEAEVDHRLILRPVLSFIAGMSSKMPIDFDVVRPGTFKAFKLWLSHRKGRYDLLHFDVHGGINKGRAQLYFQSADDPSIYDAVDAEKVGKVLQSAGIAVVVLNACESAVGDSGITANLSLELLRCGLTTIIGMSYKLLTRAAEIFTQHFYESLLVKRTNILTSTWDARRALRDDRLRQSLFGLNVDVDDSIVPIFYTRHAQVQSLSAKLGIDIGSIHKISSVNWDSAKDSSDIDSVTAIGRHFDILQLENRLIANNGFLHLFGQVGVGKTTFLNDAISWWRTTKYIRINLAFDISEFLNLSLPIVLGRLRNKVKELSGKDYYGLIYTSLEHVGEKSKAPELTNDNILITIDQAEDYLRVLDDKERSEFFQTLRQFHIDISQQYPVLMIIASCCKMRKPFNHMTLEPLQKGDALNLAFQIAPKVLEKTRNSEYERAICYKLTQSLGGNRLAESFGVGHSAQSWGNPLALRLVFTKLERSLSQPLSEVIHSIWAEGFPDQICEQSLSLKRHFECLLDFFGDELSKVMLMLLSPFKDRVPKDLSVYFDHLKALGVLEGQSFNSFYSHLSEEPESSQELDRFHELLNSVIIKLERAGFVTGTDQAEDLSEQWILHPLLPYILFPEALKSFALNTERIMDAHAKSYMARAKEWKSNSPTSINDMKREYLNFIGSFWRLENPNGISVGTPAPWYLVNLLTSYDVADESRNPDMVIVVALCEKTLVRFQESSSDWEHSLSDSLIYEPEEAVSDPKITQEEHKISNCPCQPLIALIAMSFQVVIYHSTKTNDPNALRSHLERTLDLWNLHEKHFRGDFHHRINCGAGGNALMQVGASYLDSFCAPEALESLSKAHILLQDSLNLDPMYKYQLGMCNIFIARAEMLIANHGSRDEAVLRFREDEMEQLVNDMWMSGPEVSRPLAWHDVEERQKHTRGEPLMTDVVSKLAKDISNPGSQAKYFMKLRQAQLKNLNSETNLDWVPGLIQSRSLMALAASREHDWKQAQRLNEDVIRLLDQVDYGSEMERGLKKFEFHTLAAQAAFSGGLYAGDIQHLQKGYDILLSYQVVHDTRYSMFRLLCMADQIPKDISFQFSGLSPVAQGLQLLTLLYDPTIQDSEAIRQKTKNFQEMIRADFARRMNGTLFKAFWNRYCWNVDHSNFKPEFYKVGQEILNATGADEVKFGELIFGDFWKAWLRIPAEVPNAVNQSSAFETLWREFERALFAPSQLRTNFQWLDKKYEEYSLRRKWPDDYDEM